MLNIFASISSPQMGSSSRFQKKSMADQIEQVARSFYDLLAEHRFDAAAELAAERVHLLNVATGDVYTGRDGLLEYARGWLVGFPDLRYVLMKFATGEDRVVVEYELVGRHGGPLITPRGHIPPTGLEVQIRFCDVIEFVEGRISNVRSYFDSISLLRQLGLIDGSPLHAPERRSSLELYAQPVESHAPQRNKAMVQRFVEDTINRHDPGAAVDTCSTDYVWHGGSFGETHGLASYQNVLATLLIAFPDLHVEILETIAENDRVVLRFAMSGTHLGDFQGVEPTFKRISGGGTNTYRFENSRIAEEWWGGDVLVILQQLNAAPPSLPIGG